jgi:NhaA family Na+:H+ antiporter
MAVAVVALLIANSPLAHFYFGALQTHVLDLSVLHWINDGLMAVFFLLVGLEIKRELLDGELSTWQRRALPGIAAAGGMIVPGLVYIALNWHSPQTMRGWAIPTATDIAFALGVLALLGSRVRVSLKVFLTALAIIDDLGAVAIIAVFYTSTLSPLMLALSAATFIVLCTLNWRGVEQLWPYLALGAALWFLVLNSGVHATVAGVALAATIPLRRTPKKPDDSERPLIRLEHALQKSVAFIIVPIFGFANAGVSFAGLTASALLLPIPLGVSLGLFAGKQAGVFVFAWIAVRLKLADLPAHATWLQLYGVSLLCGIGFTMSLFIGLLAFPSAPDIQDSMKTGVLVGSVASATAGAALLWLAGAGRILKSQS